ncbi:hypothetical protein KORDIASMS9_01428 [Kordia sp. SMS9]|uniref:hypothetical protein n=1 Tax=Kordia sp. SMS9 TaxID=2282170 RepID=UPI000E1093C4|nr:hypothetical protein [Kordia sp. SMS9]AXG69208.1 hypothetical protein KORDIASMS9_01428 [Kordia sp. SMS9]
MITKKGKTYMLLVVVLGIWGVIGYQIFSKMNADESPVIAANSNVTFSPKQTIEKDTFRIHTKHRDPFLGKPYREKQTSNTTRKVSIKKDSVVFPPIVYKGVISKPKSAQNIYIVSIQGTQQLFKTGKTIQDIELLTGTKKSITIRYKGKRKTIAVSK